LIETSKGDALVVVFLGKIPTKKNDLDSLKILPQTSYEQAKNLICTRHQWIYIEVNKNKK